jgi:hypothetical protein
VGTRSVQPRQPVCDYYQQLKGLSDLYEIRCRSFFNKKLPSERVS